MVKQYRYDGHASEMMKSFLLCDGVLQTVDGKHFKIHRNVPMASSPYFKAMFSSNFLESKIGVENSVILPTISSTGLRPVLDCLCSGELSLTDEVVYEVLPAAHMMQLTKILDSCKEFLINGMSLATCLKNLRISEEYEFPELGKVAEDFLLNHFWQLSKSTEFNEITSITQNLNNEKLKGKEIEIYRAVQGWLEFKPERRQQMTGVMSLINFKAIPADILADEMMKYEPMKLNGECFQMCLDAMKYHADIFRQPFESPSQVQGEDIVITVVPYRKSRYNTRCAENDATITFHGFKKSDLYTNTDKILNCGVKDTNFKLISESVNLVRVSNFIYLIGTDSRTCYKTSRCNNSLLG